MLLLSLFNLTISVLFVVLARALFERVMQILLKSMLTVRRPQKIGQEGSRKTEETAGTMCDTVRVFTRQSAATSAGVRFEFRVQFYHGNEKK